MTLPDFLTALDRSHGHAPTNNQFDCGGSNVSRECRYLAENIATLRGAGVEPPLIDDSDFASVLDVVSHHFGRAFLMFDSPEARRAVKRIHGSVARIRAALSQEAA